ncbi:hypothetical protein RCL_jg1153.t1 [Rhizophagus clarus]|uniref:Uncharacterized protein n=1 Tax=Rhizophagus clarus TaxID=94130 RepID=A0A8H3QEA9_9GLOM|nr:hypothetical protein RCL_jg1153.t1 [Rhizophagus clarus]
MKGWSLHYEYNDARKNSRKWTSRRLVLQDTRMDAKIFLGIQFPILILKSEISFELNTGLPEIAIFNR